MAQHSADSSPINVTHHLKGIDFPAKKQDLVAQAKKNGAPKDVMDLVQDMPEQTYSTMADVMKGYAKAE